MAAGPSETVRLLYHSRLLVVSVVGIVVVLFGAFVTRGEMLAVARYALPALGVTLGVLGFSAWLGWIDYVSATTLRIDARGVRVGPRTVAWSEVRGLRRASGSFRLAVRTDAGLLRFQLLVLPRPIPSLKELVAASTKAGATVEGYLVRLAEHVEEEDPEPDGPEPPPPADPG